MKNVSLQYVCNQRLNSTLTYVAISCFPPHISRVDFIGCLFNNMCSSTESLHGLEDNDLDALMADLVADISATEEKFATERDTFKGSAPVAPIPSQPQSNFSLSASTDTSRPATSSNAIVAPLPPPASKPSKVSIIQNGPHTHRPHVVNTSLAESYRVFFNTTRPNNRCERI